MWRKRYLSLAFVLLACIFLVGYRNADFSKNIRVEYSYEECSQIMYVKNPVNLRSLPSTDGEILGRLEKGTKVTVTGTCIETDWYRIEYNGSVAYVSDNYLQKNNPVKGSSKKVNSATTKNVKKTDVSEDSIFEVHFIDVGQADATLVLCDGKAMLIDGGNAEDSNLIYSYLKKQNIKRLDYIICTHAHEDHVGGLAGALNYSTVGVAYSPVTKYDSKAFNNFVKYLDKQNAAITVPEAGDTFNLGSAECQIIGPINSSDEPNNTSIVLKVIYGDTSFIFTGDAEAEEERDIINAGYDLDCTVLKVGHHGSDTSSSYLWIRQTAPEYAVISVGKNNAYGHPTEATLSKLRDADVKVYRTDMQGDIICTSNGKNVSFSVEKNMDADTAAAAATAAGAVSPEIEQPAVVTEPDPVSPAITYILNTNTNKFHYPSCSSVDQMKESNKMPVTLSREEVLAMQYEPCGRCKP